MKGKYSVLYKITDCAMNLLSPEILLLSVVIALPVKQRFSIY